MRTGTRRVEWDDERCALALWKEEEHMRNLLNHVFSLHNATVLSIRMNNGICFSRPSLHFGFLR